MKDTEKIISKIEKSKKEVYSQKDLEDGKFFSNALVSRTISKHILKKGELKHIRNKGITSRGDTIIILKKDLIRYLKKISSKI